jgi:hypothetical protein
LMSASAVNGIDASCRGKPGPLVPQLYASGTTGNQTT